MILDEIRKNLFCFLCGDATPLKKCECTNNKNTIVVAVSDIEETLARCTCENCKWRWHDSHDSPFVDFCGNTKTPSNFIIDGHIRKYFLCNQWESK